MKLADAVKRLQEADFKIALHCDGNNPNIVMAMVEFDYRVFNREPRTQVCFAFVVAARIKPTLFHGNFAEAIAKRRIRLNEYDNAVAAEAQRRASRPTAPLLAREVV